jgi:hypothetical protein
MMKPTTPEPPLIRTGDTVELLTFLGIDAAGRLLCRCACGQIEAFASSLLAEPLKPATRRRLPRRLLLRCAACRAINGRMRQSQEALDRLGDRT